VLRRLLFASYGQQADYAGIRRPSRPPVERFEWSADRKVVTLYLRQDAVERRRSPPGRVLRCQRSPDIAWDYAYAMRAFNGSRR
jgi:hypothetical protein